MRFCFTHVSVLREISFIVLVIRLRTNGWWDVVSQAVGKRVVGKY